MKNLQDLLDTFIWIEPLNSDEFFKVKETLTRMGLVSRKENDSKPTLWQSCHILQKRGSYAIVNFKQLFLLDGREKITNFTQDDLERTRLIAWLLQNWGLIKIIKPFEISKNSDVIVISFAEKNQWNLRSKYSIGKKQKNKFFTGK